MLQTVGIKGAKGVNPCLQLPAELWPCCGLYLWEKTIFLVTYEWYNKLAGADHPLQNCVVLKQGAGAR